MGYYIDQVGQNFFVPANKINDMVRAIHRLAFEEDKMGGATFSSGETTRHYSWVDMNFVNLTDVKKVFNCWRWDIYLDDEGNIDSIFFNSEKLGDDTVFLNAIAPFVKDGSYIEMNGEEGAMWRWVFNNGVCEEKAPQIIW